LVKQYTSEGVELAIPNAHDSIYLLFEAAIIESKVYRDAWPILAAKQTTNNILTLTI